MLTAEGVCGADNLREDGLSVVRVWRATLVEAVVDAAVVVLEEGVEARVF